MIEVRVRRRDGVPVKIAVEGHAGYADPGEDIVCAGVSAITFGTANAVVRLTGLDPVKEMGKSGSLHFHLPAPGEGVPSDRLRDARLLLEGMLIALKALAASYPGHVAVDDPEAPEGEGGGVVDRVDRGRASAEKRDSGISSG
ncbi:MAG: putative ribosomal protein [Hydrogenibacillus schlegelii]|uniref:Ribosomal processing cysteine protease Prp n=1 Tax=Hydrogenibacillus schlegelii TaxID=1484 RepID=A0A2T5GBA6_HYDSH|nr:ribosomal-processing cysteine protease Prp [Hydrogenibacillus schlegelii]PTQ53477.1 MAG: putative ribosomal protein [Hydrogenibacillus schlegelii]